MTTTPANHVSMTTTTTTPANHVSFAPQLTQDMGQESAGGGGGGGGAGGGEDLNASHSDKGR